ncbi:sugar transferase [Pantanalinema rosaneae CENA516]|uniref:sugar transferase n=1 Tax=Pantanalinema rosaneae TaxID=1620701 RepID=UPI003D6E9ECB
MTTTSRPSHPSLPTLHSALRERSTIIRPAISRSTQKPELQVHPSITSKTKRLIDIVGALIGLSLTGLIAIPVLIATQFDHPGPIFYSQIRCGYRGKPFRIWKFRSMVVDADKLKHLVNNEAKGGIFKNRHDPRVTRVGRFLRKTSLDEFPQFWNVLMGQMSIVGTRPPTVDEVMGYKRHHWERLNVKPGITGEWQVNGRSNIVDFEDVVAMDVAYQKKWSIVYDLQLILKTILVVLTKQGAC